jgi:hypothetical protein
MDGQSILLLYVFRTSKLVAWTTSEMHALGAAGVCCVWNGEAPSLFHLQTLLLIVASYRTRLASYVTRSRSDSSLTFLCPRG